MKLIVTVIVIGSQLIACNLKKLKPVYDSSRMLVSYPSGSTIARLNKTIYVMGDDAREIMMLNSDMQEIERIRIFPDAEELRLPKSTKADIESSVVIEHEKRQAVLFLGSGSFSPHRDSMFLFEPEHRRVTSVDATQFFDELREKVEDLNIEAATMMDAELLLGLRGNTANTANYIAITQISGLSILFVRKVLVQSRLSNAGISGMDYDPVGDILFLTFSSEDTPNSYDDGQIGESYLAVLPHAKDALKRNQIDLKEIIKLSDLSQEFHSQKIESVSLMEEERKLMLVADDDKGNSKMFILSY